MGCKLLACPGRPHISIRTQLKHNIRSKQLLFLCKPVTDQFSTVGFWQWCMTHSQWCGVVTVVCDSLTVAWCGDSGVWLTDSGVVWWQWCVTHWQWCGVVTVACDSLTVVWCGDSGVWLTDSGVWLTDNLIFLWNLSIVKFLKPWRFGSQLCFCIQVKTHLTWRTPRLELLSITEPQWLRVRWKVSTKLGNSLPETGSTAGFRNVLLL